MNKNNPEIEKYLDLRGRFSHTKSEDVRKAYKEIRTTKPGPISKLINCIFKIKNT